MKHGFIRVAAAVPSLRVADVNYNVEEVKRQILEAEEQGVEVIVFPELTLTGYTCQDLFTQKILIDEVEQGVRHLMEFTRDKRVTVIIGVPVDTGKILLNCGIVIAQGELQNIVPKRYLPNYSEFYEKRWFASAQDFTDGEQITYAGVTRDVYTTPMLFETLSGVRFGVEICEDLWAPVPPSNHLALAGADLIFNLSSSNEIIGKHDYLKALIANQSARTICGYVYSSSGYGESTQDVVFGGNAIIYEDGRLLTESERFSFDPQIRIADIDIDMLHSERRKNTTFVNAQRHEAPALVVHQKENAFTPKAVEDDTLCRYVSQSPFIPVGKDMQAACEEMLNIQVAGLAKRLTHINCKTVVIGVSGGLDSTLALLVCVRTFDKLQLDRKGIVGITMPGFGTSGRTHQNAIALMTALGISQREISITKSVSQHLEDIGHDITNHDVTYENSQARERTQILMDVANQLNGLVIGTGDLSELALGWCTYNGDHMSMYAVNASVPKTLIQHLVRFIANEQSDEVTTRLLFDVVDTPISPELTPTDGKGQIAQKTEDIVGPYELHDFFLFYTLRYGFRPRKIHYLARHAFEGKYAPETIAQWMKVFFRRFFNQQFKRSCLPDGPKVGSVSLSPRGDWRMPSDAAATLWLNECETLL